MDESGPLLSYLSETVDVLFLVSDLFFFLVKRRHLYSKDDNISDWTSPIRD
jgi:hypothetical protein